MGYNRAFIIGMGQPRSGSTWLHSYLREHADFRIPDQKEFNIFHLRERNLASSLWTIPIRRYAGRRWMKNQIKRAYFRSDWGSYIRYLVEFAGGDFLTCDLSPTNQIMSEQALKRVRDLALSHRYKPKAIFVARNPVSRIQSMAKYKFAMRSRNRYVSDIGMNVNDIFWNDVRGARYDPFNQLLKTYSRINSVFEEEDSFFGLYEELILADGIFDFCRWLGVKSTQPSATEKINTTFIPDFLSRGDFEAAEFELNWVFDEASEIFGEEKVRKVWSIDRQQFN